MVNALLAVVYVLVFAAALPVVLIVLAGINWLLFESWRR